jgi:protein phosphatase
MSAPDDAIVPGLTFASLTDVGKVRPHNEDFVGDPISMATFIGNSGRMSRLGSLFAVADGMGGHAGGEVASRVAVEALFSSYYSSEEDLRRALDRAMVAANDAVRGAGQGRVEPDAPRTRMGTTLVTAVISGQKLLVGNVGDSRAYLFADGSLLQITQDHSFVTEQVRLGLITALEARRAPLRNVLTRALGSKEVFAPDVFEVPWAAERTLLLCTDGLHGVVEDRVIEAVLAEDPPKRAVRRLIDAANAGGGPDNISVIVVRADGA